MKNKKLLFIIIIVIILILIILVGKNIFNKIEISYSDTANEHKPRYTQDGNKIYSKEDLMPYITEVEITADNWSEYFKEYPTSDGNYFEQRTNKDITCVAEVHMNFYDNLNNTYTSLRSGGVGITLVGGEEGAPVSRLSDCTCTYANGTIFILNLPEEDWITDENNTKFIYIDFIDDTYTNFNVPSENCSKLLKITPVQLLRFIK